MVTLSIQPLATLVLQTLIRSSSYDDLLFGGCGFDVQNLDLHELLNTFNYSQFFIRVGDFFDKISLDSLPFSGLYKEVTHSHYSNLWLSDDVYFLFNIGRKASAVAMTADVLFVLDTSRISMRIS